MLGVIWKLTLNRPTSQRGVNADVVRIGIGAKP